MKPISTDLRTRIVEGYEAGELSYAKVAARFCVSERSVRNFVKHRRETGSLAPKPAANGKTFLITAAGEEVLRDLIAEKTDRSQEELRERLAGESGCLVSQPTLSRTLQRLKITRKKRRTALRSS